MSEFFGKSAAELLPLSFGPVIEKIWYPTNQTFSFFDLYFPVKKGKYPIIRGAWTLGHGDLRRYILNFAEFTAIYNEACYVVSDPDSVSEVALEMFESRYLKTHDRWEEEIQLRLSAASDGLQLDFLSHPDVALSCQIADYRLFLSFLETIHLLWCNSYPAYPFHELLFLPLGGSFSIRHFDTEIAILDNWSYYDLKLVFESISEPGSYEYQLGTLTLLEETNALVFSVLGQKVTSSIIEFEALLSFLSKRMILHENGAFAHWRKESGGEGISSRV